MMAGIQRFSPPQSIGNHDEFRKMKKGYYPYFVLALVVFVIDQYTKHLVRAGIAPFDVIHLLSVLNLVHVENVGSAFGLFKSLGNAFFVVLAVCASLFVAFLIVKDRYNRAAFSLILGGAAGNLTDRILYGHVVDFIDLHAGSHHWPAFNVADAALTVVIALILVHTAVQLLGGRYHE